MYDDHHLNTYCIQYVLHRNVGVMGGSRLSDSWRGEVRASASPRTIALLFGTLLLALGFIYSYVAAFHDPTPHRIPVLVAADSANGEAAVDPVVEQLNGLDGTPLEASAAGSADTVREAVRDGSTSAGIVINPAGDSDVLYVASGGGASVVTAVEQVIAGVENAQGRSYTVTDLVPVAEGDARGLTGFYLAVGWVVGGYLVASLLAIAEGARATTRRHAVVRLGFLVPYALLLGFGGALIVGTGLDVWTGHVLPLGLVGSLTVFAVAAATVGLQALLGTFGIGAAVLLFVVLGNPSAGGPYQASLLPGFWSAIGPFIPPGATTRLVRDTVYFGAGGVGWELWVLVAYLVVGSLLAVTITHTLGEPAGDRVAAGEPVDAVTDTKV